MVAACHLYDIERSRRESAIHAVRNRLQRDSDRRGEIVDGQDDVVSKEQVDIAVAQIKRLARTANLEFALRVGAVIIHHFYGGDPDAWRRCGPKTASFRRLAQHPDLPLSHGSLYRCVALYELCDRLNAPSRWEHLGASHLRLVLGLPHHAQERILATANSKRWTVKVLQEHVLMDKSTRLTHGRRAQPQIARSLSSLKKCLHVHRDVVERMGPVSSRDLEQSLHLLAEARQHLDSLAESLQAALRAFATDCDGVAGQPPERKG